MVVPRSFQINMTSIRKMRERRLESNKRTDSWIVEKRRYSFPCLTQGEWNEAVPCTLHVLVRICGFFFLFFSKIIPTIISSWSWDRLSRRETKPWTNKWVLFVILVAFERFKKIVVSLTVVLGLGYFPPHSFGLLSWMKNKNLVKRMPMSVGRVTSLNS